MFNVEEMYDDEGPDPSPLQRGDQLFINDEAQLQLDVSENYAYHGYKKGGFTSYSLAYLEAADRLVETLCGHFFDNALTLPIVFLYRHYLELTLKELVIMGNERYNSSSTPYLEKILKGHRIDFLWQELKPLLQKIYLPPEKREEIDAVGECIEEFSKVDESSMSFRYPVDKKNKQPILQNNTYLQSLEYIDVHHLAEKMASLNAFFTLSWMKFLIK